MAVFKKKNIKDVYPYCSDYYKLDALANTYAVPMEPMSDKSDWKKLSFHQDTKKFLVDQGKK
ncbi:hypothetical protein H5410_014693 [Solanum commersonii]|uniref:Uncharacterized protein n=1 Tax=Solanum commersonii TaxID=4109 RepID=A0A9J5ZRK6_SOLCO|nr:hypothetical protein H5410_014693 [Solanum commersonii]